MKPTPRVIVAFNGSPAGNDALGLGELFGRWADAELVVACVFPPPSLAGIPFDPRESRVAAGDHRIFVRQDAEAVLAEARAFLPDDLDVSFSAVECESPLHGLCELALSAPADLLIVGSSHRGRFKRLLQHSMARKLLRDSPCALAVAPRGLRDVSKVGPASMRLSTDSHRRRQAA
jgi:nucleotide-binding universal stress UspA family protein